MIALIQKKINVFIGNYEAKSTIDANKHPHIQIEELLTLLTNYMHSDDEVLNIHTNSIYVLNKLMILQLYSHHKVECRYFNIELNIPVDVFEVKLDNSIVEIPKYKCIVSDENLLNNLIEESNIEHSDILTKNNY